MKVVIRPFDDPSLEEGVARLRVDAYPQFPETRDVEFYSSAYRWLGSHPLGDDTHRWIAVTGDDQVVGHLAATPQYYRINGQRVVTHTPCDYMVNSRHGFQALSLMRAFFRATSNCVACDMVPAVIEVESRLGAEVAGQLQHAVELLNVSRLPTPPLPALALWPWLPLVPRDHSGREGRRNPTRLRRTYGDLDGTRRYILDLTTLPFWPR